MQATRKAAIRFRERSDLLDFLLEVTAATSQTFSSLDLDETGTEGTPPLDPPPTGIATSPEMPKGPYPTRGTPKQLS